ncbi:MAG: glycosyltransferase family 4 protein [candidate division Zixibacteria bacterium]|nr:glycosyltransferase family 4 protein [candidate division Zixibacteria bacterium]
MNPPLHICYIGDAGSIHVKKWVAFFVKRGHRVSVITDVPGDIPGTEILEIGDCLPPVSIPVAGTVFQIALKVRNIRKAIHRIKLDIVHGHYLTNYGFLASCAGFAPLVQTAHGSDILVDAAGSWEKRWFVRRALSRATFVTAVTRQIAERIAAMGIAPERLMIHQYVVDTTVFTPPADPKTRHPKRILSTRTLDWKYNVQHLIRAVPAIRARVPDVEVVLAGDGPDRAAIESLIRELGIETVVTLKGRTPPDGIVSLLRSASVYVSTSITEGASLSLLEAMACGAFPVVTDLPGNREWINDPDNGFLTPVNDVDRLADRISTALKNDEQRRQTAERNMDVIRHRGDYATNMKKIEDLYFKLRQGRPPTSGGR